MCEKVIVVGDIHADWKSLNWLIRFEKPSIILSTGDFGFWPRIEAHTMNIINNETKIYWCPGNHEDWDMIDEIENTEILPNIFYMPFGSTLKLNDGRTVLFCGGADSIDKECRIIGYSWFRQEIITNRDMDQLPDENVDIVISHTCPREFLEMLENFYYTDKIRDPSCDALSIILQRYNPDLWYFSHFHMYDQNKYKNTKWFCLDRLDGGAGYFYHILT